MDLNRNLKKLQALFAFSAILMITVLTLLALLLRHEAGCRDTAAALGRAQTNLDRMQESSVALKSTISAISGLLPAGMPVKTHEYMIYAKLDEMKSLLPHADLSAGGIEENPEELRLPFTIKAVNPDYTVLINSLCRIQSSMLPAVIIKSMAITQGNDQNKPMVMIMVEGTVSIPKQELPPKI